MSVAFSFSWQVWQDTAERLVLNVTVLFVASGNEAIPVISSAGGGGGQVGGNACGDFRRALVDGQGCDGAQHLSVSLTPGRVCAGHLDAFEIARRGHAADCGLR